MKTLLTRSTSFCLAALSLCTFARADFEPDTVPADAKWVIHLDLGALRESPMGKELMVLVEKNAPSTPKDIPLDPKKVFALLDYATAYGTTFSKNQKEIDGTLILRGTDELKKIAEAAVVQATVSNPEIVTDVKGLPFPAYSIKGEVTIAFPPEPIIIVSRSQPQLLKAYDLCRGKGPAAARESSSLKKLIPKNRPLLVFAASEVPNTDGLFPENAPQARILKMASSASVAIGQNEKLTTATLQLIATDDDLAEKLHKIVQGLAAMLSLSQSDDKQLSTFLQSVKTERNGRSIIVSLAYPTDSLVQMIHEIAQSDNRPKQNAPVSNGQPVKIALPGKTIATWTADSDTSNAGVTPETLRTRTIENVSLKNGTIITLHGRRDAGENARFDCVDIMSAAKGESPLHFEAENMTLRRYRTEKSPYASGGKCIILENSATGEARFEFPGVDGSYTIKVRYVDENDGKATFSVTTKDPEPPASDETPSVEAPTRPTPPAAPAAPVAPQSE